MIDFFSLGRSSEKEAAKYLKKKGFKILRRNLVTPLGEIDLLAKADGCLVVIEVKGAGAESDVLPEARVGAKKRKKLKDLARYLVATYRLEETVVRFDVVGVTFIDGKATIRHYENAFE